MEKNNNLYVRLKELEKRQDLEILHTRELIKVSKDSNDTALKLQAIEYERRLESLNNEAGRIAKMQNDFVLKGEYVLSLETLHKSIRLLEDYKNNLEGRVYVINIVFGIIVTLINIAIKIWFK